MFVIYIIYLSCESAIAIDRKDKEYQDNRAHFPRIQIISGVQVPEANPPKNFFVFGIKRQQGLEGDCAERSEVNTLRGSVFKESADELIIPHTPQQARQMATSKLIIC